MIRVNWKQTIVIILDVVIAIYLVLAITVFNEPEDKATVCTEVNIHIDDDQPNGFLTPAEVKVLLQRERAYPLAQPMQFVSTRQMEEALLKSPFVAEAQCYKTQNGHVAIHLAQRQPVIHVISQDGEQYYVDANGNILPHSRPTKNLLVATGSISRRYAKQKLAPIASLIAADHFWKDQTVQLNVLNDGSLELVPRVGDHIVYLGQPTGIGRKLTRLRKFYKYGLSHTGWNRYERINLEFDNQIICKRRS